jgi:hypothetical protein
MLIFLFVDLCALKRVASPKHGFGYERLATSQVGVPAPLHLRITPRFFVLCQELP